MSDVESGSVSKGLEGIVAAVTRLSSVRGQIGQLVYAGYDINELAENASYEEVVHLLHRGHLPNRSELSEMKHQLASYRELPDQVISLIQSLPKDTPPMHALRTCVSAMGCFDPDRDTIDLESARQKSLQLIAQVPVMIAYFHRSRSGKELVHPNKDLGEAANFLYMIDGEVPGAEKANTMDVCYVLHADHGMNASTFSARVTIATLTDIYSAVTSAIGTLKGPLHGGANEGVIRMLQEIGTPDRVDGYIAEALAQKRKIMGIGHRVYKTLDPRAPHLKKMAKILSSKLGESKWIEMSERIAEIMLNEKHLHANVDFYSATVYYSLGIPIDLFTPIFAIARTSGWTAHILEQLANNRLIRPMSEYDGVDDLKFVPISNRS